MFIDVEFGSKVFTSVQGSLGDCEAEITKGGKPKYKKFQDVIAELGGPENIKLEFPPKCGDERDAYMTALRTEIMAGKGPDVFVALSGYGNHWDDPSLSRLCREDALFRFPKQAMERNIFLPLDEYYRKSPVYGMGQADAGDNGRGAKRARTAPHAHDLYCAGIRV